MTWPGADWRLSGAEQATADLRSGPTFWLQPTHCCVGAEASLSRVKSAARCLNRHHDLTELTAVLQIAVHFDNIVELKRTIDDRPGSATRKSVGDVLPCGLPAFLSPATNRMLYPLTVGIFRIVSSTAIGVETSLVRHRCRRCPERSVRRSAWKTRSADGIEDNARAIAARDAHHLGDQSCSWVAMTCGAPASCSLCFLSEVRVSAMGVAPA